MRKEGGEGLGGEGVEERVPCRWSPAFRINTSTASLGGTVRQPLLSPFPTLIPLPYSDDAIFLLSLLLSFYRALFTPVVRASPSSLFLFDLPVLRSFLLLFAPFSPLVFSSALSLILPVLSVYSLFSLRLIFIYFLDSEMYVEYVFLFNFNPI